MAYKIVDAETLDAGLTAVADAIRDRANAHLPEAEVTEPLVFPDGMVSAVGAIPDAFEQLSADQLEHAYSGTETAPQYLCYGAKGLLTAEFPNATTVGTGAFWGCSNLHTITFPNLTLIKPSGFRGCTALKRVVLPKLGNINQYGFMDSGVEFADFPKLTWTEGDVFRGSNITVLAMRSTARASGVYCGNAYVFTNTPLAAGQGIALVPASLVGVYPNETNWSSYDAVEWRALEDFTLDGTITGELDWDKINAELEALSG